MDFDDSLAEAAFRIEARAWLAANAPERATTPRGTTLTRHHFTSDGNDEAEHVARCRAWQSRLHKGGWAGITWPRQYGGRGGSALQAMIFSAEQARFDVATGAFAIGIGMVGPTLIAHGTDSQKKRFLDPMLRGEEIWCQLFSEPGAGSDLAGLGTRAVLDGDEWVINGQKVWTSGAHYSDWAILLARTDPDAPKHHGISYFVLEMDSPGVEVRPLRQINGVAHFNEVFLADVRVPVENLVGEANGGWGVAMTTLGNERAMIGGGGGSWSFAELAGLARRTGADGQAGARVGLADAYIRTRILSFLGYRIQTALSRGRLPGPEASVLKLAYSIHTGATSDLIESILGPTGMLMGSDTLEDGFWQQQFLGQFSVRIGGGTDEIQRNVIGERVLGLPAEPRPDKSMPFSQLARTATPDNPVDDC